MLPICCSQAQYISSFSQVRTLNTTASASRSFSQSQSQSLQEYPLSRRARFTLFLSCSPSLRLLFVVKVSGIWLGLVCFWDSFMLLRLLPAALQWHKTRHFNLKITLYIYIYTSILPDRESKKETGTGRKREYCALNSLIYTYLNNGISISILQIRNFY